LQPSFPNTDFIAILNYHTSENGGRKTPAFSGYRPQVKFDFDPSQTSGHQTFIDKTVVYPGETVTAAIRIIGVEYFAGRLDEDMLFDFREGSRIIGIGRIIQIINHALRRPASR